MNIPENAETKDLTIQGISLKAPVVVTPEMFSDAVTAVTTPEMAASILQQTLMENWRNNFAKVVTEAIKTAAEAHEIEFKKVSDLSDDEAQVLNDAIDTDALQAEFLSYVASYEPGVRRSSTGEALSPVDREANKLAVELVRDYLEKTLGIGRNARSATYKEWSAKVQEELGMDGNTYIHQLAAEALETQPTIRETAEANVAARQSLAGSVSLNIGG